MIKILYYEVSDGMVKKLGGKYFRYSTSLHSVRASDHMGPSMLAYGSNRIWEWDPETEQVRYTKNRQTGIMTPVDRREFVMIQLRAEEY